MSDEGPRDVVDGVSQVAVTAANSSGVGLRQMLLTVLAPTLALVGIAVGVVDSSNREADARKREEAIRTSELVLPYYERVIIAQDVVDASIEQCDSDTNDWWDAEPGSEEEKQALDASTKSCKKLISDFDELDTGLNRAMLVSNDDLEPVVKRYQKAQKEFQEIYFGEKTPGSDCFPVETDDPTLAEKGRTEQSFDQYLDYLLSDAVSDEDFSSAYEAIDAARVEECRAEAYTVAYDNASTELVDLRVALTDVVQAQVLLDRVPTSTENR